MRVYERSQSTYMSATLTRRCACGLSLKGEAKQKRAARSPIVIFFQLGVRPENRIAIFFQVRSLLPLGRRLG